MDLELANRRFLQAAKMLETATWDGDAAPLLEALGYLGVTGDKCSNAARLLRFASANCEVFGVADHRNSDLYFLGAVPNAQGAAKLGGGDLQSFSGAGHSLGAAFESCIGEAVEFFSHQMRSLEYMASWEEGVEVRNVASGDADVLPAYLMLRVGCDPEQGRDWFGWGNGCAAGATPESALQSALFEVVERDAIALWWDGGRPAGLLTNTTVYNECVETRVFMDAIHAGDQRVLWLFDITTEFGIPCVAAVASAANGRDAVFGFGCHPRFENACASALRELNQMEIGRHLLQYKLELKEEGNLNSWDRTLQVRLCGLDVRETHAFQLAKPAVPRVGHGAMWGGVSDWAGQIKRQGFEVYKLDLTRPAFGIAAVKVLIPGLQPYPSRFMSKRLRNQRLQAGIDPLGKREWDIL